MHEEARLPLYPLEEVELEEKDKKEEENKERVVILEISPRNDSAIDL